MMILQISASVRKECCWLSMLPMSCQASYSLTLVKSVSRYYSYLLLEYMEPVTKFLRAGTSTASQIWCNCVTCFFFCFASLNLFTAIWSTSPTNNWDKTNSIQANSEETWCDSGLELWLKNQRNVFTLCHYERALWNTTIKSLIVTVNVKLIGLTLREELLSSPGPLI